MEHVNKELCEERHRTVNERDKTAENRLNDHSDRIKTIEEALIKLTLLVEAHEKKMRESDITTTKVTFWQTKSFEWLIKAGCIIAVMVTAAAIGFNYYREYVQTIAQVLK